MSLFPSKDNGCGHRQFFPPPLSPFPPVQNIIRILVALFTGLTAVATACPICLGIMPQQPTVAAEVRAAQAVVIVQPADVPGAFEVRGIVKGDAAFEGSGIELAEANPGDNLILARVGRLERGGALSDATCLRRTCPAGDAPRHFRLPRSQPDALQTNNAMKCILQERTEATEVRTIPPFPPLAPVQLL